jgi:glycosyltransferase involved in cell wall biosynthesis
VIDELEYLPMVGFSGDLFVGQRVGGATRYYSELLEHLPALGTSVSIDLKLHINEYLLDKPNTGKFFRLPKFRGSEYLFTNTFGKLRARKPKARIFHPTYYSSTVREGLKVITVLDMIHELFPEIYGTDSDTSRQKIEWVNSADVVIAISESTANDLKRLPGFHPNSVEVVPLGVDDRFLAAPIDHIERDQTLVLYLGSRSGYKNWESAIIAMSDPRHKDKRLLHIGGGRPTKSELAKLRVLGLENRVSFETGDDDFVIESLRRAAVLIYPSLYEGFGLPLVEARATGCPVIATRGSSVTAFAGPNSVLTDGSPEALSEALAEVPFASTPGESGLRRWIDCAVDHHNIYQKLLNS